MDLSKTIQDLYAEKEKLERIIASLEELQGTAGHVPALPKPAKRRGRKSMNPSERQRFGADAQVLGRPSAAKTGRAFRRRRVGL
jgi:hypothetical protein